MADPLQKRMPGLVFLHLAVVALVSLVAGMLPRPTAWAQAADVCPSGLVWREACPGDHLCVTPAERTKVRAGDKRGCPGCPGGQAPQGGICVQPSTPATTSGAPMASAAAIADPFLGVTGQRSFLIIAPDEFMAALAPLVDHKNATGMPTLAVSIGQLTARFMGADDPEKIKRGIQFAHEHLATRYVMLVGDAHWFPVRFIFFKNFSRSYPNHPNERNLPIDGLYAPSDLYYANLYHHRIVGSSEIQVLPGAFDNWDADSNGRYNEADWGSAPRPDWNNPNPDRVDGYPDVAVARATAHSATDVTTYVNKIIRYETQQSQHSMFTFIADGNYPRAAGLIDPVAAMPHLKNPEAFFLINKPDPAASAHWAANASPESVADKINSSVWVGYLGHGSQHSWDGRGFDRNLVKPSSSNNSLPVVFTDGCETGRFAIEAPFDYEYIDTRGAHHIFAPLRLLIPTIPPFQRSSIKFRGKLGEPIAPVATRCL